jgi:hypothetical protein
MIPGSALITIDTSGKNLYPKVSVKEDGIRRKAIFTKKPVSDYL